MLEGRCRTYQERCEELGEHLSELLAYAADGEAERAQSHAVLVSLAEENLKLQHTLQSVDAQLRRKEKGSCSPQRQTGEGESGAEKAQLSAIARVLTRSAPVTGIRVQGASLLDQVKEIVALVALLRGRQHLLFTEGSKTPAAVSPTPPRPRPASAAARPRRVSPARQRRPAAAVAGRTTSTRDPTLQELNSKLAALDSAIRSHPRQPYH